MSGRSAASPVSQDRNVVLVTGASGVIGTDFCRRYSGTYEIVATRHLHPLDVDGAVGGASPHAPVYEIQADLRQPDERARVMDTILKRYGRIDGLVNLMGGTPRKRSMLKNTLAEAPYFFDVNAVAPIEMAVQAALTYWQHHDVENAERNRSVVNVTAAAGVSHRARRSSGAVYAASKAAFYRMSLSLADELRPYHVRVMALAPVATPKLVATERVSAAIAAALDGDESARALWVDADEDRWMGE
jgi:NAD(P)-dependent dehydrogenase (short-subunit alcohol dehydrogenase family)